MTDPTGETPQSREEFFRPATELYQLCMEFRTAESQTAINKVWERIQRHIATHVPQQASTPICKACGAVVELVNVRCTNLNCAVVGKLMPVSAPKDAAPRWPKEAATVVRILASGLPGAAQNAVREDCPEIAAAFDEGFAERKDVATSEREMVVEECAKICDEVANIKLHIPFIPEDWEDGHIGAANECAEKIRAFAAQGKEKHNG